MRCHGLVVLNQLLIPQQSLKVRLEIHKHDQMMYKLNHLEHPEKMNAKTGHGVSFE
jgi:hypothetical protein